MRALNILSTFGVLLIFGCQSGQEEKQTAAPIEERYCLNEALKEKTLIQAVAEENLIEQISLPGKIEYNENDLVVFKSLLSGLVSAVKFEMGDRVVKGQVLAEIKSTEIQSLVQQRKYQKSQLSLLRDQIANKKQLLADGLVAKPELLELEHAYDAARIELDRIDQSLAMFRAAGEGSFQLLAPRTGFVIQKNINVGQSIHAESEALFSISNLSQVWVMVNVFASNLRHIQVGDRVKVKSIAYPDQIYHGKIDKIFNVFDDDEHVMKARVVLDNPKLNLKPGLSADIIIDKQIPGDKAYAIPNKAVLFNNNTNYILLYHDDCHIEAKQVEVVYSNEDFSYIKEKLAEGSKVVSSNALLIFEEINNRP